ncbi:MAG TPA: TonB family protein [Candidatus Acidoferrales bacterium]|nr:TonB family protein [Candidatus Acidoferrales bacterium]
MSDAFEDTGTPVGTTERRSYARKSIQTLAYVDLGEDNGGLVLNLGEGGIAVRSAVALAAEHLPKIRFQMPHTMDWVEATGRVVWTADAKRMAGVEFVNLPSEAGAQIREWMNSAEEVEEQIPSEPEVMDAAAVHATPVIPPIADSFPEENKTATTASFDEQAGHPGAGSRRASAMLAALASKSQQIRSETEKKSPYSGRDAETAIHEQFHPTANQSAWVNDSILNLKAELEGRRAAPPRRIFVRRKSRNWMSILAVAVLLAGLSFFLGISAGQIGMGRILDNARIFITGNSSHVDPPQVAASSAAVGSAQPAKSPPAAALPPAPAPHKVATRPSSSQPEQRVTAHRASPPPDVSVEASDADTGNGSTPVLNFPETPVSATNSVAISSRLYIPLPEISGVTRGGNIKIGRLEHKTNIFYPPDAAEHRIEGIVKVHAMIGKDGAVRRVNVVSGDPVLGVAASEAIREWRYTPTLLDGKPIETEAEVTVTFRLP